ncbi:MAG: hypothetical protein IJR90_07885, partial [Clostridia bacterium]|nr:hypothetical protein [Clostridia bacterium]
MRGHIITDIVKNKLKNRSGINRTVALLVVIAVVLAAVVILIPTLKYYRDQSRRINCAAALDSAYRQYVDGYLYKGGPLTYDEAKEVITTAMLGWDDLCPGGGKVYLVKDEKSDGDLYRLVCGMHGEDKKECTRLNAGYVLDTVREKVADARDKGEEYPASVTLTLNGEELTAYLVDEYTGLRRGTY